MPRRAANHALPKLEMRLRRLAYLEADAERLGLEGAGDGEDDVGELCGRAHEQIGMDYELQGPERIAGTGAVGMRHDEVGAKPTRPRTL